MLQMHSAMPFLNGSRRRPKKIFPLSDYQGKPVPKHGGKGFQDIRMVNGICHMVTTFRTKDRNGKPCYAILHVKFQESQTKKGIPQTGEKGEIAKQEKAWTLQKALSIHKRILQSTRPRQPKKSQ